MSNTDKQSTESITPIAGNKDPFANVLVYEQLLPFECDPFTPVNRSLEIPDINQVNEQLLHAMLCMDEHPRELEENTHDTSQDTAHDFYRLEAKLDLLLRWTGKTLSTALGTPDKKPVKISEKGLSVEMEKTLPVGTTVLIKLCLKENFPEPLRLPGNIVSSRRTRQGHEITIMFDELYEETRELLEKFIFRKHRRQIALQKQQSA